jgi:hypothetical protein
MKKTVAVIFLLIFSVQTFYTASKYCVNKNRPMLKCNGKCYLSKKIKMAEGNQDEEIPQQLKQWVETTPCTITTIIYQLCITAENSDYNLETPDMYSFNPHQAIFHPPSVIFS